MSDEVNAGFAARLGDTSCVSPDDLFLPQPIKGGAIMDQAAQASQTTDPKPIGTTRGQVAREVAGVNTIEVKMTLADAHIDAFLAERQLTVDNEQERYIY